MEAAKADPETATVTYDKDHHAGGSESYNGSGSYWHNYNASASNGSGFAATSVQTNNVSAHDFEAADAFVTFTATNTTSFVMKIEPAGLTSISWNIEYTGLDEEHHGSLSISERGDGWGFSKAIHNSNLLGNGVNDISASLNSPYHLWVQIDNLPENATVTVKSISLTYDVAACKTARN